MSTLKAEIFAIGKWNGIDITRATLIELSNNFARLKEVVDVPLKFGHNDEQPLTDGQPALGWIETVWIEGTKLFAKFVDMPDVVFKAIEKKRFKNVSIEVLFNVRHKGVDYGTVLTAVAILGVDMPAVNTLSDLQTYMTVNNVSFSKFATFSKKPTVGVPMTDDEKAQMDALRAQIEAQKIVINDNAISSAQFSSESAKDKALIKSLESEKINNQFAAEKLTITNDLEQLVKDTKITPATRDKLLSEFSVNTKDHVIFTIKMLKDLPANSPGMSSTAQQNNGDQNMGDANIPADVRVSNNINTLMTANSSLSYEDALKSVFSTNPKLAEEYKNQNNEG